MRVWQMVLASTGVFTIVLSCTVTLATASSIGASPSRNSAGVVSTINSSTSTVYAWGAWGVGNKKTSRPKVLHGIVGTVTQIATSNYFGYALTSTGVVWAWGSGGRGELGNGTMTAFASRPLRVKFPPGVTIASLPNSMPYDTGLAIDSQGNVWGWGYNHRDELCLPSSGNVLLPTELPLTEVTLAIGAGAHALYYSNGTVYACGDNADGELGDGTKKSSPEPKAVVGLPNSPVQALESSWQSSGALLTNGSYYDWGYNALGELGDGNTIDMTRPALVTLPATATQISQGGCSRLNGQTVALLSDGSVWAWGSNAWGQLGNGQLTNTSSPVQVDVPSGVTFSQVDSGGSTSYALDSTGNLWSWGENNFGQLGVGGSRRYAVDPISVGVDLAQVSSTAFNVAGLVSQQVDQPSRRP